MALFRIEELQAFAPRPNGEGAATVWADYLDALASEEFARLANRYGLAEPADLIHFLAQIAAETGGFILNTESMRYSPERILVIFGEGRHSAKVTAAEARLLAGNQKALAERVYGIGNPRKVIELGNNKPGDGWRYIGRGPMQTTGKADYKAFGEHAGVDLVANPERLADPLLGLQAACWEWQKKGCSQWARAGNLEMVTRRINGGYNGLDRRRYYLEMAKRTWSPMTLRARIAAFTPPPEDTTQDNEPTDSGLHSETNSQALHPGSTGPLVEAAQRKLAELGYYTLAPDGDYGDRMIEAVLAFKHRNNLPLTDIIDADTWAAFDRAAPRELGPRESLTDRDLKERGSRDISDADTFSRIGKWLLLPFGGLGVAQKSGALPDPGTAAQTLRDTKSLFEVSVEILALIAHNIVPLVALGGAIALIVYARRQRQRRVEKARSGKDLSL